MRLKKLIDYFGTVKKAYEMSNKEAKTILGDKLSDKFLYFRNSFDPIKKINELRQQQIDMVCWDSSEYPNLLKEISDPPICLFIKGNYKLINDESIYFSIVGTRKPTSYGQYVATQIAQDLISAGIILVSGMAIGIDTIVHMTAINEKGKTIAVLGCGVDIIYPSINRQIYSQIINGHGIIISEVPPGSMVNKGMFVARNRIISGLSKGTLVIEGLKNSGTLITARYAAEQGRDVFAIPSPITSPLSEAPNLLIKQGAKLVTNAGDIIEELGLVNMLKQNEKNNYSNEENIIIGIIKNEPKLPDDIADLCKIPICQILQLLSILEMKKVLIKLSDGRYQAIT